MSWSDMDIIISETWLTSNTPDMLIHQADYVVFQQDWIIQMERIDGKVVTKKGGGLTI